MDVAGGVLGGQRTSPEAGLERVALARGGERLEAAADRVIAGRAAEGDSAAFRLLVMRYGPMMRGYARRILNSTDDVDDVVQDSFIAAWRQLPQLQNPAVVKSWLMRIVSRKAINRTRARKPLTDFRELDQLAAEVTVPSRVVEAHSQIEELSAALTELPEEQRQCWVLREVAEYSYEEIADELDLPISTVRGLLARARKYLVVRMEAWREDAR